jgi:hypothetical protein
VALDFWIGNSEDEKPGAKLHYGELEPLINAGKNLDCRLLARLYAFWGADAEVEFSTGELQPLIEEAVQVRSRCAENIELVKFLTDLIDVAGRAAGQKAVLFTSAD